MTVLRPSGFLKVAGSLVFGFTIWLRGHDHNDFVHKYLRSSHCRFKISRRPLCTRKQTLRTTKIMSALPPKADSRRISAEGLLLTHSGHRRLIHLRRKTALKRQYPYDLWWSASIGNLIRVNQICGKLSPRTDSKHRTHRCVVHCGSTTRQRKIFCVCPTERRPCPGPGRLGHRL